MICFVLFFIRVESQFEHHDFISPTAELLEINNLEFLDDEDSANDIDEHDMDQSDSSSTTVISFFPDPSFSVGANETAADFNITYSVTYLFSLTRSLTEKNGKEEQTILITYMLQKTALTPIPIKNVTTTAAPTVALKTEFFHPAVIIGATSILLFIIGAIYTSCCRKTARINYGALMKAQKRKNQADDSDSLEDVQPKKGKKPAKSQRNPPAKSARNSQKPSHGASSKGRGKSAHPKK